MPWEVIDPQVSCAEQTQPPQPAAQRPMALTSPAALHGAPSLGAGRHGPSGLQVHLCARDGHSSAAAPVSRTPAVGGSRVPGPCRPSREERQSPHTDQAWALPPPQTPGLAQQPRLPCSRPRGPSEGEPHGPQPRRSIFNKQGDSCQESCPPQGASPVAPAPPQGQGSTGGLGSTGGTGVHRGDRESTGRPGSPHGGRGSTGGTARTVPVSPATACTPQAHTFPPTLMLTCTHRLTPEPQAMPGYPASSQPWGPEAGAGVGEPGCYLGMEGREGSSGHVGRRGRGQSVSGRQNQGAT